MKETTRANRDYVITIKLWVVFAGKPQRDGDQVGKITVGSGRAGGPRLRAVDPWLPGRNSPSTPHQLLSDDERARLATMATIVRFKKGEQVYSNGEPAKAIFNIISGLIKIYKPRPDGGEYVSAFLYPEDLFGLSEEGRYVNSAKAITPATVYSLPLDTIRRRLSKGADLEFHVIALSRARPWVRSLTHSPEAVIQSPALTAAA